MLVCDTFLRECTARGCGDDVVTGGKPAYAFAHSFHDTGEFVAGYKGRCGLDLVIAADHQDIGKINSRCLDVNQHLAGGRQWSMVLLEVQRLGWPECIANQRSHG